MYVYGITEQDMTIGHDNGNQVCLLLNGTEAGVYVRQDREYYPPQGKAWPWQIVDSACLDSGADVRTTLLAVALDPTRPYHWHMICTLCGQDWTDNCNPQDYSESL